jgi:hypothetical protein
MITILEIILPVLCTAVLVLGNMSGTRPSTQERNGVVFQKETEQSLLKRLHGVIACPNCYMAYSPENNHTTLIITDLIQKMGGRNNNNIGELFCC